jgi:hypothetical protein
MIASKTKTNKKKKVQNNDTLVKHPIANKQNTLVRSNIQPTMDDCYGDMEDVFYQHQPNYEAVLFAETMDMNFTIFVITFLFSSVALTLCAMLFSLFQLASWMYHGCLITNGPVDKATQTEDNDKGTQTD